jgi:hypothetical protein
MTFFPIFKNHSQWPLAAVLMSVCTMHCASRTLSQPPLGEDAAYEGEDEDIQEAVQIVQEIQKKEAEKANQSKASRGAHAKGLGCALGDLFPIASRDPQTKEGAFAQFTKYSAFVRFSNAPASHPPDKQEGPRGFALKLKNVPGQKLWNADGNNSDLDLLMVSVPIFPNRSVAEYNQFVTSRTWFLLTHLPTVLKVRGFIPKDVTSVIDHTYFSIGAIKWGKKAAKLKINPCKSPLNRELSATEREENKDHFLSLELKRYLKKQDACFELSAQIQKDPVAQPVEDLTVNWETDDTPFLPFARLTLPVQSVLPSDSSGSTCEASAFNPWRTIAEHRPLGSLMRARKAVYDASLKTRM